MGSIRALCEGKEGLAWSSILIKASFKSYFIVISRQGVSLGRRRRNLKIGGDPSGNFSGERWASINSNKSARIPD
jgi:hypothetical protein